MFVRRIAAVVAVSGLVLAGIVVGNADASYAAPPAPTITYPDPGPTFKHVTDLPNMDMGGSDSSGTAVRFDVTVTNSDGVRLLYCPNMPAGGTNLWICNAPVRPMTLGYNTFHVTSSTSTTNADPSPESEVVIYRARHTIIDSPAEGSTVATATPLVSGTAEGTLLDLYSNGFANHYCADVPIVNGAWSCVPDIPLAEGLNELRAETQVAGGSVFSDVREVIVDTTPPAAPVLNAPPPSVPSTPAPTIYGTGEPGAAVEIFVEGVATACPLPPIDSSGIWSCTVGVTLAAGPHAVRATQRDEAGNVSPQSTAIVLNITDNTPPAPPVVTSPAGVLAPDNGRDVYLNSPITTVSGTGEPGATIIPQGNSCNSSTLIDSAGNWSCLLTTPMSPDGVYTLNFQQMDAATNFSAFPSTFLRFNVDTVAPAVPTVTGPAGTSNAGVLHSSTTNARATITGQGELGATVQVYRSGSIPVACVSGPPVVGANGFSCTPTSALPLGVHSFGFTQTDRAGNVSGSPVVLLRMTIDAVPVVVETPPPFVWTLAFASDKEDPAPGENITLWGSDLPVGATVTAELHSDPVPLGATEVKDDGAFRLNTHIPNNVEPGDHHYVVTVTPLEGEPQTVRVPVRVVAPPLVEAPPPAVTEEILPPLGNGVNPATADRTQPDAPNTLTQALPRVQDILSNPAVVAIAAGSSLALLFLVALPAELLNSALDDNYERLFGRFQRPKFPWWDRIRARLRKAPVVGALALTTLAALVMSFSDPRFGFDLTSLRLFLACAIGMFVLGYVANIVTSHILQRRWNIASVIELQPFGIVIALVGVALSRLLDFAPGLLVGLVLGLALATSATLRDEARYVLTWSGVVLGLSVVSWLGYSFFSGLVAPETFGGALVDDTFVAIATEGISALVVGLLPLGLLDGRSLYQFSKLRWLATYLVSLLAFFVIVVPSGALWGDIRGPFWLWLTVLIGFAALCLVVYLWLKRHPSDDEDAEQAAPDVEPDAAPDLASELASELPERERETVGR